MVVGRAYIKSGLDGALVRGDDGNETITRELIRSSGEHMERDVEIRVKLE